MGHCVSVSKFTKWMVGVSAVLGVCLWIAGCSPKEEEEKGDNWVLPSKETDITAKFTDANFKAAVYSKIGKTAPAPILYGDVDTVASFDVSGKSIASLAGIEYFTALKTLYCGSNELTALDVSKNTALTYLSCYNSQLTALDVSKNTALKTLYCSFTQLTALDVSKNIALIELGCSFNQLTALDVSQNTALTRLECSYNQLTALDVSKNTALKTLNCGGNELTALDVSKNTSLTTLYCYNNQLTALDVSKNTALTTTTLDVTNNYFTAESDIVGLNKSITRYFTFSPQKQR